MSSVLLRRISFETELVSFLYSLRGQEIFVISERELNVFNLLCLVINLKNYTYLNYTQKINSCPHVPHVPPLSSVTTYQRVLQEEINIFHSQNHMQHPVFSTLRGKVRIPLMLLQMVHRYHWSYKVMFKGKYKINRRVFLLGIL